MIRFSCQMLMALATALAAPALHAENWPTRAVTVVSVGGPGGAVDLMLRLFLPRLRQELGQPFVIDYKPGAAGQLGATVLARARPDGYTFGVVSGATSVVGPMTQKLNYDPRTDLVHVVRFSTQANMIYVKADSPFRTLRDALDFGRANPGKLSYGSLGQGTTTHLTAAALFERSGVEAVHVPYSSSAPLAIAALSGTIDLVFDNVSPSPIGQIKGGSARALAVTSLGPLAQLPGVPSVAQAGVPDFEIVTWFGLAAPAGTPREAIDRLASTMKNVMAEPAVQESFTSFGMTAAYLPPEEMPKFLDEEAVRWAPIVKAANQKMQE